MGIDVATYALPRLLTTRGPTVYHIIFIRNPILIKLGFAVFVKHTRARSLRVSKSTPLRCQGALKRKTTAAVKKAENGVILYKGTQRTIGFSANPFKTLQLILSLPNFTYILGCIFGVEFLQIKALFCSHKNCCKRPK
jgi:hypothetical protein